MYCTVRSKYVDWYVNVNICTGGVQKVANQKHISLIKKNVSSKYCSMLNACTT